MHQFEPTDKPPAELRQAYLDSLAEHQEYFLEERVAFGQTWCLGDSAYVVVDDGELVEFHVDTSRQDLPQMVFDAAIAATGAAVVLCKSFDSVLLHAALARPAVTAATGILFRSLWGRPSVDHPNSDFRRATPADIQSISAINDDFFGGPEEIEHLIATDGLYVLERGGAVIGCGTRVRVNPHRDAVDLGMLVSKAERGKGYGTHIIARMRDDVLDAGLVPVCGCAARNKASWRALSKAGFADEHRLLRIELPPA